jgi:hypothetical protein
MARVPASARFLIPSSNIGHRLFAPDMFGNVGGLLDVHRWYFPSGCAKRLLISSRTVTFDKDSHGQLAAVIYEWLDVSYLGKTTSYVDNLPVSVAALATPWRIHVDDSALDIELAENIHLHDRCACFKVL